MTLKEAQEMLHKQNTAFCRYWNNLPKFETPDQIPYLPCVDNERTWLEYYVPKLIVAGAIPKENLEVGATYLGKSINANEAVWDGEQFHYHRTELGYTFIEKINHFQDDNGFDVFVPIKKLN